MIVCFALCEERVGLLTSNLDSYIEPVVRA